MVECQECLIKLNKDSESADLLFLFFVVVHRFVVTDIRIQCHISAQVLSEVLPFLYETNVSFSEKAFLVYCYPHYEVLRVVYDVLIGHHGYCI